MRGVPGARVVRVANKGSNRELVNAVHPNLSMVVKNAKAALGRKLFVTRTSLVQVMKFRVVCQVLYIYILYFFLVLLYFVKGSIRFASGQYEINTGFR